MKPLFVCEIPGRVAIKKNSTRRLRIGKRTITAPSARYMVWQNTAIAHVKQQWTRSGRAMITCPLFAKFYFHFLNRQSESDTSNCIEGPADVLTRAGVIKDDKLIVALYAQKEFGLEPKTIIELYEAEGA